ncbi:MAG: ATP-binding cassette domain-containing protein [Promethearchaeota archaeon]
MNQEKAKISNSFNQFLNDLTNRFRKIYESLKKKVYGVSELDEAKPIEEIQQRTDIFVVFLGLLLVSIVTWLISPTITIIALTLTFIFGIVAISLNHQVGQTGIINFGVVGFFAVGAYATALLTIMGWFWLFALIGGMIISGIVAFIVSIPSLKLREDYFAIAIITLGEIFRVAFQQEDWLVFPPSARGFYGGTRGLTPSNAIVNDIKRLLGDIPPHKAILDTIRNILVGLGIPETLPIDINFLNWFRFSAELRVANIFLISSAEARNLIFLGIIIICCIITYVIFERIYNSPIGRLNKAIREDDLAIGSLGFDVYKHKIIAMTLGSMFAGLAGGLIAYHQGSINPLDFVPLVTFIIWTVMVVGGFANHRGAIIGALVVLASQPIVVNQKANITSFFGSLMDPFLPAIVDAFIPAIQAIGIFGTIAFPTNAPLIPLGEIISLSLVVVAAILALLFIIAYRQPQEWKYRKEILYLSGFLLIITLLLHILSQIGFPTDDPLILLDVSISLSFVVVTAILALLFIIAYRQPQEWKYRKEILYLSGFLLIITLIPFILSHLPILPVLTFDFHSNITDIQFVALSIFFKELDPLLARSIALGLIMVLFLLFRPEGVLKERRIYTINSREQLEEYQENKKSQGNNFSSDSAKNQETTNSGRFDPEKELLRTENLNKSFGGITALQDVSIAVKRGPLIGIIGPNGSGKSTFFNVVTGLHDQDRNKEGKIIFDDQNITTLETHERHQLGLGRTFQQGRLFPNMTVLENLLVAPPFQIGISLKKALFRAKWIEQEKELHQRAFQILDFLDILHIWEHKTSDISGGQQKLVSLGRSLMSENKLILLDEPVAGVNPTLANKIFNRIVDLQESGEQSFVIIEHNMDVQLSYCDYIYVFNKGEIVAEGTCDQIIKDETVIEAYLGG